MEWAINCIKESGELRKQFNQFSIPNSLRDDCGIKDGDSLTLTVRHRDYEVSLTVRVTSGGEVRLPNAVADRLAAQALQHPESAIRLGVDIDEARLAAESLEDRVKKALAGDAESRRARLRGAPKKPKVRRVMTTIYDRNPDVVAEALFIAQGICDRCSRLAPFERYLDGSPYLEVHHRVPLSKGGDDTVENAEALCPNCHRWRHYGPDD